MWINNERKIVMKELMKLLENGMIKLNDGTHIVNDIYIMFINQPYAEVICKDDNGDVLFRTNNIDIYNKNFIELKKIIMDSRFQNKCLYEYKTCTF